jgi:pathogenesis-related protein 1
MQLRMKLNAILIGLVVGICTRNLAAQMVELRSVQVAMLEDGERDRFLAAHNAARKGVGVDPVAWSEELSKYAFDWLSQQKDGMIEKAKSGWAMGSLVLPEHRKVFKYGENIAGWGGTKSDSAEIAVTLWLREKAVFDRLNENDAYKFGDEKGKTEIDAKGKERPLIVGHYTAIVWKDTTHIGAAKLVFELADEEGTVRKYVAVVCNYDPPGNRNGEKPY